MPLQPKQQPPYYTPATTTPTGIGGYERLFWDGTINTTSGTTETDLYIYNLPANTLTTNGDSITIEWVGVNTVPAENHITRFYLNDIGEGAFTETVTGDFIWRVKIVRQNSVGILITVQMWQEGGTQVGKPDVVVDSPYDFATPIEIKFTGQCTGLATIQTHTITIDKQSYTP